MSQPNSMYISLCALAYISCIGGTLLLHHHIPFYCYFLSSSQLQISKPHASKRARIKDQGVISLVELSGKATYHEHKDKLTLLKHDQLPICSICKTGLKT